MVLALPLLRFNRTGTVSRTENRNLAREPCLITDGRVNKNLFREYSTYLEDRFGGRKQLILLNRKLDLLLHRKVYPNAFEGKDGWCFFLNRGSNYADFFKRNLMDKGEIEGFKNDVSNVVAWCNANGMQCIFLICPNKHNIYPEKYCATQPEGISRADQMCTVFEELGTNYIFPRDFLLAQKSKYDFPLYYETDTHWNAQGAYLASLLLKEKIKALFPTVEFPDIEYSTTIEYGHIGDINGMMAGRNDLTSTYPVMKPIGHEQGEYYTYLEKNRPSPLVPDSAMTNVYDFIHTQSPDSTLPRAIVFRDSFFGALEPFVSPLFAETEYIWTCFGDQWKEHVLDYKPDIIIFEKVERAGPTFFS